LIADSFFWAQTKSPAFDSLALKEGKSADLADPLLSRKAGAIVAQKQEETSALKGEQEQRAKIQLA
jgi:hypothetical protein